MLPFHYAEHRPSPTLARWVRNAWWLEVRDGAPPIHHVPPDGCTSLIRLVGVADAEVVASGPWLRPLAVPVTPGQVYAGIRLQPGAAAIVLGLDPRAMVDAARPLSTDTATLVAIIDRLVATSAGINQLGASLETALGPLALDWPTPDPVVSTGVARLTDSAGEIPIADLARDLGVSARTLRRRFGAATGISPKQFARIRRLLRAAWGKAHSQESWSRLAAEAGFADQPHLTREMVDLTGLTPGAFEARVRATEHTDVIP